MLLTTDLNIDDSGILSELVLSSDSIRARVQFARITDC